MIYWRPTPDVCDRRKRVDSDTGSTVVTGNTRPIMRHSYEWSPRSKAAARKLMYTEQPTPKLFRSKHVQPPKFSCRYHALAAMCSPRRTEAFRQIARGLRTA